MKFIKCHYLNTEGTFLINADLIETIETAEDTGIGTDIMMNSGQMICVKENMDQVEELLYEIPKVAIEKSLKEVIELQERMKKSL